MLNENTTENTTETATPPAAQVRVKREEFARAIAALEARRQEEAQYLEGTVAVEDTLRELQVDVSAEEVMQQIEAQRAGYAVEEEPRLVWDPDKIADFKLVSGIVLVPLLAVFLSAMLYHPVAAPFSAPRTTSAYTNPLWMPPPMMPPAALWGQVDESGFNASSVLKPLSQVADDQPVRCNSASLQTLLDTYTRRQLDRPYNPLRPSGTRDPKVLARSDQLFDVRTTSRRPWVLIKHDGRLYLRAWVAAKFTGAQAEGSVVTLHSSPRSFDPGVHAVPITLPLSFRPNFSPFGPLQFDRSAAAPTLSAIHVSLDQHAWEKW